MLEKKKTTSRKLHPSEVCVVCVVKSPPPSLPRANTDGVTHSLNPILPHNLHRHF